MALSKKQIAKIAARYGFEPTDRDVIECAEQAISFHGQKTDRVSWDTDWQGILQADKLLDGYLRQTVSYYAYEGAAAAQFQRDAYGE